MIRCLTASLCLIFCCQLAAKPALRAGDAHPLRKLAASCDNGCDDDRSEIHETAWGIAALSLFGVMATSCCCWFGCSTRGTWERGPHCNAQKSAFAFKALGITTFFLGIISAAVHYLEADEK